MISSLECILQGCPEGDVLRKILPSRYGALVIFWSFFFWRSKDIISFRYWVRFSLINIRIGGSAVIGPALLFFFNLQQLVVFEAIFNMNCESTLPRDKFCQSVFWIYVKEPALPEHTTVEVSAKWANIITFYRTIIHSWPVTRTYCSVFLIWKTTLENFIHRRKWYNQINCDEVNCWTDSSRQS